MNKLFVTSLPMIKRIKEFLLKRSKLILYSLVVFFLVFAISLAYYLSVGQKIEPVSTTNNPVPQGKEATLSVTPYVYYYQIVEQSHKLNVPIESPISAPKYITTRNGFEYTYDINIYRLDPKGKDKLINSFIIPTDSFDPYYNIFTDTWKTNHIFFTSMQKDQFFIYDLDLTKEFAQPEKVASISSKPSSEQNNVKSVIITDLKYLDKEDSLLLIRDEFDKWESNLLATRMYLLPFDNKKPKKEYEIPIPIEGLWYTITKIVAKSNDNKQILLRELGGEGGDFWQQFLILNRENNITTKINNLPANASRESIIPVSYLRYDTNEDMKMLYTSFSFELSDSSIHGTDYINWDMYNYYLGLDNCLLEKSPQTGENLLETTYKDQGGTIMLHDMYTGKTTEIYRNTAFQDDLCMNIKSRIFGIKWVDQSTFVFLQHNGIFQMDINTKKIEKLYEYPGFIRNTFWEEISAVSLPYIIVGSSYDLFSNPNYSDSALINLSTKEVIAEFPKTNSPYGIRSVFAFFDQNTPETDK